MAFYTRRQAALLLALVTAAGVGIAVGHWRRAHPDLADRLERFDRRAGEGLARTGGRAGATEGEDPGSLEGRRPAGLEHLLPAASSATDEARARRAGTAAARSATGATRAERPPPPSPRAAERLTGRAAAAPLQGVAGAPIDLNRASAVDLERLPGIGPTLAARIVGARDTGGPFASVDELRRVNGIGEAKLERVRAMVTVSP